MALSANVRLLTTGAIYRECVYLSKLSNGCRCYSSGSDPGGVRPPGVVKRYLVDRVMGLVEKSTDRMEKAYPTVFQIYKTFKTGLAGFVADSKEYYRVSKEVWSGRNLHDLSRRQLEILTQVPRDFRKIVPVLLVTLIPGGSFAFPLAYVFPRLLLSAHFWTEQQRRQFWQLDLKHRLEHLQPVMDHMTVRARHIDDTQLQEQVLTIIRKLQHAVQPTVGEVLAVRPLFEAFPFHLDRLSIAHLRHLAKGMQLSLRRQRLAQDATLLLYTDQAMAAEGVDSLTDLELEKACFCRGLNPVGLRRKEQILYLQHWTQVSTNIDERAVSLLLHLPLFLAFQQPTNRPLISPGWRYRLRRHRTTDP